MPFIAPLIVSALGLVGTVAAVANIGIGLALSVGASLLAKSLQGSPRRASANPAADLQTSYETDSPTMRVVGRRAVGGHLIHRNTYADGAYVQAVFALGEGLHDGLDAIWVDGDRRQLLPVSSTPAGASQLPVVAGVPNYVVGRPSTSPAPGDTWTYSRGGGPLMSVRFYAGSIGQSADAELIARARKTATGADTWTANSRLAGVAHAIVTYRPDEASGLGASPNILFEVRGSRLYDWRKDSTVPGGSGSHRFADPATWEYSANPIVALYNYRRGLYLGGQLVHGMGVPAEDFDLDSYTAAAAICDQPVTRRNGQVIPRYTVSGVLWSKEGQRSHGAVIEEILQACAGEEFERAGVFSVVAGAARVPVASLTDASWSPRGGFRYRAQWPRSDRRSGVAAQFVDPGRAWKLMPAPIRLSAGDAVTDGGEMITAVDYPTVNDGNQAQRLAEILRRQARKTRSITGMLPASFVYLERGDWLSVASERYGFAATPFRVADVRWASPMDIEVTLTETGSDVFAFNAATDEILDTERTDLPAEIVLPGAPQNVALAALAVTGTGGQVTPWIRVTFTGIDDPRVGEVVVAYRVKQTAAGQPDHPWQYRTVSRSEVLAAGAVIVDQLYAATTYQVMTTLVARPERALEWSPIQEVVTGASHVVLTSLTSGPLVNSVTWDAFADEMKRTLQAPADAVRQTSQAVERLGRIVNDLTLRQYDAQATLERSIRVTSGDIRASVDERFLVAADQQAGTASAVSSLAGEVAAARGGSASLSARFDVVNAAWLAGDQALASSVSTLTTSVGANTSSISTLTQSVDGVSVRFGVTGTINNVTGGFTFTGIQRLDGQVSYTLLIDGSVIVNGSVTAAKISTNSLSAISANVGVLRSRATGARLQIEGDTIFAIDANGVVRVRLGLLTANPS